MFMTTDYTLTLRDQTSFDEIVVQRGLDMYNAAHGFPPPTEIAAFLYANDNIVGGVVGELSWGWLYVDLLWVDAGYRGYGNGADLMTSLEQEALRLGVPNIFLATTSFQAEPFYKRMGYEVFGTLENRPPGYEYFYLKKCDITFMPTDIPIIHDPDPEHIHVVRMGLKGHSILQGVEADGRRLSVFLIDERNGDVLGGLIGATYWGWLDIQSVWIKDEFRGQDYGAQLLTFAEQESLARGCPHAFVDVASFQAVGFFDKQGYAPFGLLENRPPGHKTLFMRKDL
jgi:GNAT superfamily N-acetyltransferase